MRTALLASILQESRSGFWGTDAGTGGVDVRVVRNGDIQDYGVRWGQLPLRGVSVAEADRAAIREGDILITTSGNCGYVAHVAKNPDERTIASNFVRILRFDSDAVVPRYLYHFFNSHQFRSRLAPFIRGTTLKNLSLPAAAEQIEIPLPEVAEQRKIAEILDKADALRATRCVALNHVDTINQALFFDMFGDPATNPKGWPQKQLAQLVRHDDTINYGVVQPGDETEDGVPLVRVGDLIARKVRHSNLKRISPAVEAAYKRSRLRGDEILVSCVGSIGVIALADESVKGFNIARAVARVPLAETTNRHFVAAYLETEHVQRYFINELRTVSQPTLNIKQIAETAVPTPPIGLQLEFARQVEAAETLRQAHRGFVAEADALFDSLRYRAFRGEL